MSGALSHQGQLSRTALSTQLAHNSFLQFERSDRHRAIVSLPVDSRLALEDELLYSRDYAAHQQRKSCRQAVEPSCMCSERRPGVRMGHAKASTQRQLHQTCDLAAM